MASIVAARAREREQLLELARLYVERLERRLPIRAAVVAGSVARGDFNVWSDVDVLVVSDDLPAGALPRSALLLEDVPARVQPVGYTRDELVAAKRRGNPLVLTALELGVPLRGRDLLDELAAETA